MKTLSIKLPETLDAQLTLAARQKRTTKSSLLRDAITAHLNAKTRRGTGSCLDLARDLAGCVAGPGDLSFNKKRLAGYGQ